MQHAVEAPASASRERVGVEQGDVGVLGAVRARRRVAAREVVEHDDLVAGRRQLLGDDRADVARAARHEDPHVARHRRMVGVRSRLAAALVTAFAVLPRERRGPTPTAHTDPDAEPDGDSDADADVTPTPTPTPTPEPTKAEKKVLRDYRKDGVIEACDHKRRTLKKVLKRPRPRPTSTRPTCARRWRPRSTSTTRATARSPSRRRRRPRRHAGADGAPAPTPFPTTPPSDSGAGSVTPLPGGNGGGKPPSRRARAT